MTIRHFKGEEEGVKSFVTVQNVDPHTGDTIFECTRTVTIDKVTSIVASRTWRRAMRGTPDPVWFMKNESNIWVPIEDRGLVDWEVRMTWIYHSTPIKKSEGRVKLAKKYVDKTDYAKWREKLRQANNQLMN